MGALGDVPPLDLAIKSYLGGDLDKAAAILSEILQKDPQNGQAQKLYQEILKEKGQVPAQNVPPAEVPAPPAPGQDKGPKSSSVVPESPVPMGWLSRSTKDLSNKTPPSARDASVPEAPAPPPAKETAPPPGAGDLAGISRVFLSTAPGSLRVLNVELTAPRPHAFEWDEEKRVMVLTLQRVQAPSSEQGIVDEVVRSLKVIPSGQDVKVEVGLFNPVAAEVSIEGSMIRIVLSDMSAVPE